MKTDLDVWSYVAQFFLEREKLQTKVAEKIKTYIFMFNSIFENRTIYEIMWKKHCKARQATNDNIAHYMLDIQSYKNTQNM
jgi:hypothetical protein